MEAAGAHRKDVSMTRGATLFLTLSGLCRLVMMCLSMLTTGHCADHVWHSASDESHDGSHTEGIGKTDLQAELQEAAACGVAQLQCDAENSSSAKPQSRGQLAC